LPTIRKLIFYWKMGTYLSTPVTEKRVEYGDDLSCSVTPLIWGVVDMQGWRKTMEDAHVAQTDTPLPWHLYQQSRQLQQQAEASPRHHTLSDGAAETDSTDKMLPRAKVFAVFDGHGGAEVARFCQLYFVATLTQQSTWLKPSTASSLPTEKQSPPPMPPDVMTWERSASAQPPAYYPFVPGAEQSDVGRALIDAFHSLDRMIDDPSRR
jgi:hypothetical protein